ncbi:hypothetical protein GEU84_016455 [Fertoebacter nigrum]|uniref:Uncharacterized protein n=1 Tax=Fertoeibacter niger TaxID=2656921 RepID=A0A8X8H9A4_9RHOB|nr:hypothetical protein [Fertoeibacter niger]NUB45991.1 hypothetical protein [Fertoeibacter niger]
MSETLANLTNTITAIAAIGGVVVACRGLRTWKHQILWQQGRGLAVSLVISANKIRLKALTVQSEFAFHYDEARPLQESQFNKLATDVRAFVADLDSLVDELEGLSVEAKLMWDVSFDEVISVFRDSAHSIRGYVFGGIGSISPITDSFQRDQARGTMNMFRDDIYGQSSIFKNMKGAIESIEHIIKEKLPR